MKTSNQEYESTMKDDFTTAPKVSDVNNAPFYIWGTDCRSWVLEENSAFTIKQELIPPGRSERLHLHQQARQFFFVLEGTAYMFVNGEKLALHAGQGISVPNGLNHYIANEGENDLKFLVFSAPPTEADRINL
jgi:mannose-6-phosphate isomerase-like protein (cupin superfamily)